MNYYKIAVNFPGNNTILTYGSQEITYQSGQLVEVPLGRRFEKGVVLEQLSEFAFPEKLKTISKLLSDDIIISENDMTLFQWMSEYYHYPLGKLVFDCLPKIMKRPKELVWPKGILSQNKIKLTDEQELIVNKLMNLKTSAFSKSLIHGVTGSGKTIIYLELIKRAIREKRSVLFLVPEVNLTPQFTSFFLEQLDCDIYCYHSGLKASEKYQLWKDVQKKNDPYMILGVRSSIFLPFQNLGLIVVDEEHDSSFKQDDRCTYHARDVALKKASLFKIPVIIGSATPALENFYQYRNSENYYSLKKRVSNFSLPEIKLVDLKSDSNSEIWPLHEESLQLLKDALAKKEQALVFVNKLGYSNFLQCRGCGHRFMCPNCSVTLTPYRKRKTMECHHCTYKQPLPGSCPECACLSLSHNGFGTEKVEEVLKQQLPQVKIDRFDRDELKSADEIDKKLTLFHNQEIDLLIGTQMLSKGHNFKKVNTVIVLGIDSQLNFPDFRSQEKVYQLLTQITGRAGRFGEMGKVIIQTHQPDLELFKLIKNHEFDEFYFEETEIRKIAGCPPFKKMATISFHGRDQKNVMNSSLKATEQLKILTETNFKQVNVFGPKPSIVEKRANKFSWITLVKSSDINQLHNLIKTFELNFPIKNGVTFKVDIDPQFIS